MATKKIKPKAVKPNGIENLVQQYYNAPNEKLKKMYRAMILKLDPDFKEIK